MPNVIVKGIYCPICDKEMNCQRVQIHEKQAMLFFCKPCEVGIYDFDPAFNKWRDTDKKIPCSVCGYGEIKWFARFMDGFFKSFCPRCKTVMKKDGDVKFGNGGDIIIPEDMEEDVSEEVEVQIPMSHVIKKLGKDRAKTFMDKRKKSE